MTKVQSYSFADGLNEYSLHPASSLTRGESLIILGAQSDTLAYCAQIESACRQAGIESICIIAGEDLRVSEVVLSEAPELIAQLLIINTLPEHNPYALVAEDVLAGDYIAELLAMRCKANRSTIVLSESMPVDWCRKNSLGIGTFWTAAQLGMGMILDPTAIERRALSDRITVPDSSLQFFNDTRVASLEWIRDPAIYEYFGMKEAVRPWHWVSLRKRQRVKFPESSTWAINTEC